MIGATLGSLAAGSAREAYAQLLAVDAGTNRAQVSIEGSAAVWLPMLGSVYTGVTVVRVRMDPSGPIVVGSLGVQTPEETPAPPADPADNPLVSQTAVVTPTWSGTWRSIRGAWDRWNVERYGGRSTLWQGNAYGSGPLTGLATYGSRVTGLHAVSISRIAVNIVRADETGTVVLQGSPSGSKPSGAPSSSGSTASGSDNILLPSDVREAMRTGAVRGLALVGSTYLAVRGTSSPSGMALSVTYQVPG